jgi:hypothetical protein
MGGSGSLLTWFSVKNRLEINGFYKALDQTDGVGVLNPDDDFLWSI